MIHTILVFPKMSSILDIFFLIPDNTPYMAEMTKEQMVLILGGSVKSATEALNSSRQAVWQWRDPLPRHLADRVIGAAIRKGYYENIAKFAPDYAAHPARTGVTNE